MRILRIGLLCALLVLSAMTSHANVVFHVSASIDNGRTLTSALPGDILTIDIRLSNDSPADFITALGGAVMDYDSSILSFIDGVAADTTLFCTDLACGNGLVNSIGAGAVLSETTSSTIGKYVQFVGAVSIVGRNGDGSRDPGIDGVVGGGDAEFRLRWLVGAPGETTLSIGTTTDTGVGNIVAIGSSQLPGDVRFVQGINASVTVVVAPEPSTTLLLALGLAGFSGFRERREPQLRRS